MNDLISRQAAIDALYHVDEYNGRSVEAIRNLPSAEPEIIHCKDCKYWDEFPSSTINIEYHKCSGFPIFTESKSDDFCSRGKWRDDETD